MSGGRKQHARLSRLFSKTVSHQAKSEEASTVLPRHARGLACQHRASRCFVVRSSCSQGRESSVAIVWSRHLRIAHLCVARGNTCVARGWGIATRSSRKSPLTCTFAFTLAAGTQTCTVVHTDRRSSGARPQLSTSLSSGRPVACGGQDAQVQDGKGAEGVPRPVGCGDAMSPLGQGGGVVSVSYAQGCDLPCVGIEEVNVGLITPQILGV